MPQGRNSRRRDIGYQAQQTARRTAEPDNGGRNMLTRRYNTSGPDIPTPDDARIYACTQQKAPAFGGGPLMLGYQDSNLE